MIEISLLILEKKDKGAQPSLAEIYIDNRTRGNGSIATEKASNVIVRISLFKHNINYSC